MLGTILHSALFRLLSLQSLTPVLFSGSNFTWTGINYDSYENVDSCNKILGHGGGGVVLVFIAIQTDIHQHKYAVDSRAS